MYRVRIWLEDGRIETQFCQDVRYADMKQSAPSERDANAK